MSGIPLLAACHKDARRDIFSSPDEVWPEGPRDYTVLTVLSEDAVAPIGGAALRYGEGFPVRSTTNGFGVAAHVSVDPQDTILFEAPECFSYATPPRGEERFHLRTIVGGNPLLIPALHDHEKLRLPGTVNDGGSDVGQIVNLLYPQYMWGDEAVRDTAERLVNRFTKLCRLRRNPIVFTAGTVWVPGALNVQVVEDVALPEQNGGVAEWWASTTYVIYDAKIRVRDWRYARHFIFMAHELCHAVFGFRHPQYPSFMDPNTMYTLPDLDQPTVVVIMVSATRLPGTTFYRGMESDVAAMGVSTHQRFEVKVNKATSCRVPDLHLVT